MKIIIPVILGVIAVVLGYWLGKRKSPGETRVKEIGLIEQQAEEKRRNKEAILGLMVSGNQPLTDDQVEKMIGIPESTVTRYFDELEKEGKIKQVGKTGRDVFYKLK